MTTELPSSSPGELSSPPEHLESPGGGGGGGGGIGGVGVGSGGKDILGPSTANTVSYPDLSAKVTTALNGAGDLPSTASKPANKKGSGEEKPRKKRARTTDGDGKEENDAPKPAKAPRKARAPRKPKAEPGVNGSSASTSATTTATSGEAAVPVRQHKITDLVHPPSSAPQRPASAHRPQSNGGTGSTPREHAFKSEAPRQPAMGDQSVPSPRSGQRYDPIRSSTMDSGRPYSPSNASQASPTKMPNRASASPSISSLIDPPAGAGAAYAQSPPTRPSPSTSHAILSQSPSATHATPAQPTNVSLLSTQTPSQTNAAAAPAVVPAKRLEPSDAMDVDSDKAGAAGKPISRKTSAPNTNPPSKAASPKPPKKEKAATPPLPPLPGTGAVASLFGAVPEKSDAAPTIVLNIPLNGETNKYINFAQLAEKQYGFSGLHPRLTSQRDRLARVAAAGAALENAAKGSTASGDDMSLDGSDNENESTADVGDTATGPGSVAGDGKDAGDGPKPRKKRRFKEDMYDKEDPFVDDTELAWEEQAATSKDGFFVYSGPLIPEDETARVERADGTIIKPPGTGRGRGRGRGGGPGSRGGAAATAARGGAGPSSRGGQTTRKPRMKRGERAALNAAKKEEREAKKAEKAALKAEKQAKREAREAKKAAAAAAAGGGTVSVDATPKSIKTDAGDATDRTADATPSKPPPQPLMPQPTPPPPPPPALANGTSSSTPAPAPAPVPAPTATPNGAA